MVSLAHEFAALLHGLQLHYSWWLLAVVPLSICAMTGLGALIGTYLGRASRTFDSMIHIAPDNPARDDVSLLLSEHLADMFDTSPAESVHALDHSALSGPGITLWTAREDGPLLGCGALKEIEPHDGEIKSMRTTPAARGRGVATLLLSHLVEEARRRHYGRLWLETGSEEYFAPARRLYGRHGFLECEPFADYVLDPHSVYMVLDLGDPAPGEQFG